MTRIALIHALAQSVPPINEAFARLWPEPTLMNLLDDSLSADVARTGLDARMHQRFMTLADYAVDCGADAILFTCSAFGPCIEAVARDFLESRCRLTAQPQFLDRIETVAEHPAIVGDREPGIC